MGWNEIGIADWGLGMGMGMDIGMQWLRANKFGGQKADGEITPQLESVALFVKNINLIGMYRRGRICSSRPIFI